jgi:DNA-binding NtrC family response regulator
MNGLDSLKVFKQSHPPVPVIIASGVLDEAAARHARWLRAFDCLPKPFACHEVITMVRSAPAGRGVCRTILRSCRSSRWD